MALSYRSIDRISDGVRRRGPRDSMCLDVIDQLNQDPKKIVAIDGGTEDELQRFYKAMIQWRSRHRELGIGIRKGESTVFVWFSNNVTV